MFDAHTDPIFKDLQILKFNFIYRFHISKILFQVKNNLLPQAFTSMFSLNNQLHCYFKRTSKQFHIPKLRTNIKKISISYWGPKIFNSLPTDIQFSNTLSSFTRKLFTFLSKNQKTSSTFIFYLFYLFKFICFFIISFSIIIYFLFLKHNCR